MTIPDLKSLLRQHHDASARPHDFMLKLASACAVDESTAYRWLNTATKPSGEKALTLVEHLKSIKEPKNP
jgi:hypothetical protein